MLERNLAMRKLLLHLFQAVALCSLYWGALYAQTLPIAQTPSGGLGSFAMIGLGVFVVGIGGVLFYFLYWKPRHPAVPVVVVPPGPVQQVGTALSADATAIVSTITELISHMKDQAAATAAKTAPAGGDGVAGVLTVKVVGTPSVDIPAITSAYFSQGAKAAAKRPA
jgi:hypothetical protein